jgi:hypothetical protein
MNAARSLAALLASLALAAPAPGPARAADEPPARDPAPAEPAEPAGEAPGGDDSLPSLDELLGLEDESAPTEGGVDPDLIEELDPDRVELERKLTSQEAADELASAVQQMHETAFRLEEINDTGVVTQRLQTEILTKLDVLIRNAEDQSGGGGSSSSSSGQQGSQPQQQPGQQPGAAQQSAGQPEGGDGSQDGMRDVPFQEGQRNVLDAARAAWGSLPERTRDRLMEGSSDYFSEWYRAWTEAYYQRIAEEVSE